MKYFCFRFDVDTHKCLHEGVPQLLNLARDLGVKFTFFVNFGQAVNRISYINAVIKKRQGLAGTKSLSALTKLGIKDYLFISLFNPFIGNRYPSILKKIVRNGHEIGLHGGKNHETWSRYARTWGVEKIRSELVWGKQQIKRISNKEPFCGFASPSWNGSEKINNILRELNFTYVADTHSNHPIEKVSTKKGLKYIPTNITGEPEGVGYIEYCRAAQMSDAEILSDFQNKLKVRKRLATVYDHPYYVGIQELNLVKSMIQIAKAMGYKIVTMREIAKKL
jgi:peptidoglycan/xylan/chitin deacetylase (PgdA/CDA1 family)